MKIIKNITIKELPEALKLLSFPPDEPITVVIKRTQSQASDSIKPHKYLFLNDDVWDDPNPDTPTDLARNHDKYLYGNLK